MAGHRLDAEQVRRLDHTGAAHRVGEPGALPRIAAVEQQRTIGSRIAAQAVDQGFQMGEATELAESSRRLLEIERGERIGVRAVWRDSKPVEKGAADQMRWPSSHRTKTEIDAGLAKISRQ